MADPTLEFVRRFARPELWEHVEDLPIFKPHEMWAQGEGEHEIHEAYELDSPHKQGKFLYRVDVARLHKIAAAINENWRRHGKPVKLQIGHTRPPWEGQPQERQPRIIGYGIDARVGRYGRGEIGLIIKAHWLPGHYAESREYPERSAQFMSGGATNELPAVALLRVEPKLKLGLAAAYARQTTDGWVYYERGFHMDPVAPPDASAPDEEWNKKADCYMSDRYPHLGAMHEKYASEMPPSGELGTPPGGGPPGAPGIPDATGAAPPTDDLERKKREEQMARERQATHYERENTSLKQRLAALEKRDRLHVYERELTALTENYEFDLREELTEVENLDRAGFDRHKVRIQKRYARKEHDPTYYSREGFVPVEGAVALPAPPTKAESQAAVSAMSRDGVSDQSKFPEYVAKIRASGRR